VSEESDAIGHFAPFGAFDPAPLAASGVESIGLDAGATLTKLCVRTRDGALSFASFRSPATDRVLDAVSALDPTHLGVTGCGAAALAPELGSDTTTPIEFEAWARGADEMLARTDQANDRPYLLVSVGTGTSALRVDGDSVERMGGTALGGGAALGLGRAIIGARTPEELNDLALEGTRQNVDLMVSDLFEDASDVGAFIASSFGKVARSAADERPNEPSRADLAAALLGIVSDNIGLLASAYARAAGVDRIVYGGSTFLVHPQFADVARAFGMINGVDTVVLSQGGHAGSLGAMVIARRESAAA